MKKNPLEKVLVRHAGVDVGFEPVIFNLASGKDRGEVKKLLNARKIQSVSDDYDEQLRELFGIKNPSMVYAPGFEEKFRSFRTALGRTMPLSEHGRWAYYPWIGALVHVLPETDFQLVRTARNQNLITKEEQEKFYNATIGIAGLSVGSSVAMAIALQGGGRCIRLADMDRLALTNTNRIRTGVQNLGVLKVVLTAREIYQTNPYVKVEIVSDGLTPKNIAAFFRGLDIVIDEIDNLAVKCLIREQAKRHRIAVVMAADNGDNAVVDVERYDLNPKMPYFHGRMGKVSYETLLNLNKFEIGKLITKLVGAETVTERMQQSLLQMGKTIVSWPQLGGAALVNGAAVAYCVRKILNGQPLESDRALISLDEKLVPGYSSPRSQRHRRQIADNFRKIY
ncbi:MAG TPA: ThiF family adenylyltransferase [Candidatus Paceibacterota bacterium]|nr:ThiF family adenylyltransferase [Candidatus Paceibacterota bacterium]